MGELSVAKRFELRSLCVRPCITVSPEGAVGGKQGRPPLCQPLQSAPYGVAHSACGIAFYWETFPADRERCTGMNKDKAGHRSGAG